MPESAAGVGKWAFVGAGIGRWRDPDSNWGHHDFQAARLGGEIAVVDRYLAATGMSPNGLPQRGRTVGTPMTSAHC